MTVKIPESILVCHEAEKAKEFVGRIWGKKATFVCTIGNTETGKIPGISAAGAVPEITDFTPAADVELLYYGKCKCFDGVPVTPTGIPTPGIITMSAIKLAKMPIFSANGGVNVRPTAPYFELDGKAGKDIRTGKAVENPRKVYETAVVAGESLGAVSEVLVVGESIAGGTTTALGVLTALGYDAHGKVSSSMPDNPHSLKDEVVRTGIRNSGLTPEQMKEDPMLAIAAVGDPMMPAAAGLIVGAARHIPVIIAGGTQMAAVLAIIKGMEPGVLPNLAIGTTKWIVKDGTSNICDLVKQIGNVPVLAANLDFGPSKHPGLSIYETGIVKEGVGAGGASIAAITSSKGKIDCKALLQTIEQNYETLMKKR